MTPLPSPLDGTHRQYWDFSPAHAGPSTSTYGGSVGGGGRNRATSASSSVFEEFRQAAEREEQQLSSPTKGSDRGEGPSRSKTLSFFDTGPALTSPTVALSPPPNPPSRHGSLNRHGDGPRSSVGSWLDESRGQTELDDRDQITTSPSPLRKPPPHFTTIQPSTTSAATPDTSIEPSKGARFLSFGRPSTLPNLDSPRAVSLPNSLLSSGSISPRKQPPALSLAIPEQLPVKATPGPIEDGGLVPQTGDVLGGYTVVRKLGQGAFSKVVMGKWKGKQREGQPEVAALKLILKKSYAGNERMRTSVVREVEVLKNIEHPSLASLLASFPTPVYTVLVMDYCPGGELFDFLADWHSLMPEALARRILGELAGAIGWMHSIGLVHRDIKLENILLTSRPFPCASPDQVLATLPTPFIKLTDFGLSRFVAPTDPPLTTRCGSEEYAAPELLMGKPYDGRKTDAWAFGVCAYAVLTGVLPFVDPGAESASLSGSVLSASATSARGRRSYLLKIAKGEFGWPGQSPSGMSPTSPLSPVGARAAEAVGAGSERLVTAEAKEMVGRFLERDPDKRAGVYEVWEMEWMEGEGRLGEEERGKGSVRPQRPPPEAGAGGDPLEEDWVRS